MVNLNEDGYTDTLQSIANLQHLFRESLGQQITEEYQESASEKCEQENSEEEKNEADLQEKNLIDPNEHLDGKIEGL